MRSVEAKAQGVLDAMQIEDESREIEAKKTEEVVPEKKEEAKLVKGLFPQNILSSTIIKKADDKDEQP